MKYLTIIALLFLLSCTKELPTPEVKLTATFLSNEALLLKGETTEKCFRGFIISNIPSLPMNAEGAATLGFDVGIGEFTRAIGLTRGEVWYVRAWAIREGETEVGYSHEQSFLTW